MPRVALRHGRRHAWWAALSVGPVTVSVTDWGGPMTTVVRLRSGGSGQAPGHLIMLRMGVNTLSNASLTRACGDAYDEWGLHAFSVLELPGGDWAALAEVMPIVVKRAKVLRARSADLISDGFPVLPTGGYLHWSVVLSAPESQQFARVRRHFEGPIDNPVWEGGER